MAKNDTPVAAVAGHSLQPALAPDGHCKPLAPAAGSKRSPCSPLGTHAVATGPGRPPAGLPVQIREDKCNGIGFQLSLLSPQKQNFFYFFIYAFQKDMMPDVDGVPVTAEPDWM